MVTFTKPNILASDDAWGGILNGNLDLLNDIFATKAHITLYDGSNDAAVSIGNGGSGNRQATINMVGDDVNPSYGLRIIRANTGVNADSRILHRGTGPLEITAQDAGTIQLITDSLLRLNVNSDGRIGVGSSGVAEAILAVTSTTMGFLPPRMTTTQMNAIAAPVEGLMVMDITAHKLMVRTNTAWVVVGSQT